MRNRRSITSSEPTPRKTLAGEGTARKSQIRCLRGRCVGDGYRCSDRLSNEAARRRRRVRERLALGLRNHFEAARAEWSGVKGPGELIAGVGRILARPVIRLRARVA